MAGVFSLSVVMMVGQLMCSKSMNIQEREGTMRCVCVYVAGCVRE